MKVTVEYNIFIYCYKCLKHLDIEDIASNNGRCIHCQNTTFTFKIKKANNNNKKEVKNEDRKD